MYTIWKSTSNLSLPILYTNDLVLAKLAGGADLMLPGVTKQSLADLPGDLSAGVVVGIGTLGVPGAVRAIGRLADAASALKKQDSGKAVEVLHVEGDYLWALGRKVLAQPRIPGGPDTQEIATVLESKPAETKDNVSQPTGSRDGEDVVVPITLSALGECSNDRQQMAMIDLPCRC